MSGHAGSLLKFLTLFLRLSRLTSEIHTLASSLMILLIFEGWVSIDAKTMDLPGDYLAFPWYFSVEGSSFEVSSCRFTCFGQSAHSWNVSKNSGSNVEVSNFERWCETSLLRSSVHCESALFAVRARTFLLTCILCATTIEPVAF